MDLALTDGVVEIVGALDLDRTDTGISPRRLPAWTRPQIPDLFMEFMVTLGTGVRIAFRTDASWIELDVMPTGFEVIGSPPPVVAYDLVVDGTRVDRRPVDFGTRLVLDLATTGKADAALAASIFHYGEHTVAEAKALMAARGIPVRQ